MTHCMSSWVRRWRCSLSGSGLLRTFTSSSTRGELWTCPRPRGRAGWRRTLWWKWWPHGQGRRAQSRWRSRCLEAGAWCPLWPRDPHCEACCSTLRNRTLYSCHPGQRLQEQRPWSTSARPLQAPASTRPCPPSGSAVGQRGSISSWGLLLPGVLRVPFLQRLPLPLRQRSPSVHRCRLHRRLRQQLLPLLDVLSRRQQRPLPIRSQLRLAMSLQRMPGRG
mmetsp:Transcript_17116/g.49833  ORF Transcript_17116/g.49833 Transcript_17116/m.49833 type:complete len:221 (+) Transcript_17116:99-761(+)